MKQDKIFIGILSILIFSLSLGMFIRGRKEISVSENRNLEYFPKISKKSFIDTSFQKDIEKALVDQIPIGEGMKINYKLLKNRNSDSVVSVLKTFDGKPKNRDLNSDYDLDTIVDNSVPEDFKFELQVVPRGDGSLAIEKTNHLIYSKTNLNKSKPLLKSKANNYNQLVKNYPDISFHCNYIEIDQDIDFINGEIKHDLIREFYSYLDPSIKRSGLYLNRPSQFQEYFYKTDHHWNAKGQIEGYKNIMKNLKGSDEELLDIKIIPIKGVKYNGPKSRENYDYDIYDNFEVTIADISKHEIYKNGKKSEYGRKQKYVNNEFEQEKGKNYYADANGGDSGVVKYEFNNPKEQNLLVFADSYSNPINEFIASHYNNTYFIDLRAYESVYGKKFDFGEFTKENNINQVLYTGYILSFANDVFLVTD